MVRGIFYSLAAVILFLVLSMGYMLASGMEEETMTLVGGWLLLLCFFAVGPVFFVIGYWHHVRRHPGEPRWDRELNE